jgi:hypothetical protein
MDIENARQLGRCRPDEPVSVERSLQSFFGRTIEHALRCGAHGGSRQEAPGRHGRSIRNCLIFSRLGIDARAPRRVTESLAAESASLTARAASLV